MEVGNTYKGIVLGAFRRLRGIGRDDELSCREEVSVAEDLLEVEGALCSSLRLDHLRSECDA